MIILIIICVILFFSVRTIMWYVDKYISKCCDDAIPYAETCIFKCGSCKNAKIKRVIFDFDGQIFETNIKDECKLGIKPEYKCKNYEEDIKNQIIHQKEE